MNSDVKRGSKHAPDQRGQAGRLPSVRRQLVGAALAVLCCCLGCGQSPGDASLQSGRYFAPVYLIDVELLEPPAVESPGVFKPALEADIDEDDPSAGQLAGFRVTLATRDPAALQMRLVDRETGRPTSLQRVDPPTGDAEQALAAAPGPFDTTTRDSLTNGDGVFWFSGSGDQAGDLIDRFTILIPESLLTPLSRLDMFTDVASDGSPVQGAQIELVEEFFYLAVIGDSLLWGNGLRERDKMTTLTAEAIERETHQKVITQRYARSGARILPMEGDSVDPWNFASEVPTVNTSVTAQADLIQRPELVDLILLDGCSNDIGNLKILDPRTTDEELIELTQAFCGEEMTGLLRKVRSIAPQARIVVPGFVQTISEGTDSFLLRQWVEAQKLDPTVNDEQLIDEVAMQTALVRDEARISIRAAIDTVNAETGGPPMIAFADPAFGPENAVFAENPWLWGFTAEDDLFGILELELEVFPEDPLSSSRLAVCFEPNVVPSIIECLYLSVGHPNPTGARVFADAIIEALRELGVLPNIG
jgi:lysophospholipase L1-like esterase